MKVLCIDGPLEGKTVEVRELAKNCPALHSFTLVVNLNPTLLGATPPIAQPIKDTHIRYTISSTSVRLDEGEGQWVDIWYATTNPNYQGKLPTRHLSAFMLGQAPASDIVVT